MKHLIIGVLLFLTTVQISAQQADTIRARYYIDGRFYKEMPAECKKPGFKYAGLYQLKDSTQNGRVFEIVLPEGTHLSDKTVQQAIPDKNVFCRDYLLSASYFYKLTERNNPAADLKVGDKLPDFSVKDNNGQVWTNQNLKGKPAVLNFWYTGCIPCIKEMPEISQWVTRYPGAVCLAVTYQPAKYINPIVQKRGFAFHQLVEAEEFWKKMQIKSTPTTFIVDKDGIIRLTVTGTNEEKRAQLEAELKKLTASL